jgi:tryptophan synthase alpha chain
MAFMPFITAGDPNLAVTSRVLTELTATGVDLIEIGIPYSDPIADGPVIQASYQRALDQKITVSAIFAAIQQHLKAASGRQPPFIAMVPYAMIFRRGSAKFVTEARDAGFAGLIVPDLPAEEAVEFAPLVAAAEMDLIELIAPTTTPDRTARILATGTGFLYCISVAGTTGMRDQLPPELRDQLRWLKSRTKLPLAVGFGVSRPEQVDELRGLADGVIVGSAIVRKIGSISTDAVTVDAAIAAIGDLSRQMIAACAKR